MPDQAKLDALRAQIDALDEQIQALITERARCAQEVARVKRADGGEPNFYRPEREAEILRTIQARNHGPLSNEEIARLFREIMSACLALEQSLQVAYLGPQGTFTQAAVLKHFGHSVATLPLDSIHAVFREVEAGDAQYGVVPVENSTEGVVNHTLDSFMQSNLSICGEVELRIHHCLLGQEDRLEGISKVYAHHQSLAQCREWLDKHLPHADRVAMGSNAEAARRVAAEDGAAAIASEAAAELYGLHCLHANIEDEPDNTTRFLVIGRHTVAPSAADKTSLLVSSANQVGALYRLLAPLVEHKISMTRIESRPSRRGMWDYVFFIDIEGHAREPAVAQALAALRGEAAMLKVLGSYPRAVL